MTRNERATVVVSMVSIELTRYVAKASDSSDSRTSSGSWYRAALLAGNYLPPGCGKELEDQVLCLVEETPSTDSTKAIAVVAIVVWYGRADFLILLLL